MIKQAQSCDLKELVQKFILESIGREIEKTTSIIYPLQNVFIRKVKILKAPKFDLNRLMDVHGDYSEDSDSRTYAADTRNAVKMWNEEFLGDLKFPLGIGSISKMIRCFN